MYFFPGVKKSPPPTHFQVLQVPSNSLGHSVVPNHFPARMEGKKHRGKVYIPMYIYIYTPSFTIHGESEYTRSRIFKISSRLKKSIYINIIYIFIMSALHKSAVFQIRRLKKNLMKRIFFKEEQTNLNHKLSIAYSNTSSWWFQPLWKILISQIGSFPQRSGWI